jgi:predicted signal transduction protein with EAL and GGDEF domain
LQDVGDAAGATASSAFAQCLLGAGFARGPCRGAATGYSSLSYLSSLPIDCLKIDRSFVMQTSQGGRHAAIAQAVISLGHSLGMRVLAEGVEMPEQLAFLRRHGCDVQLHAEVASKG